MAQYPATTVNQSLASERPSERALAHLWKRADTLTEGLVTNDGRRFQVIYPGRPSSRAGPDFRDAIIATEDGGRLTGDVELHVRAPDWYAHGHDVDPGYNGVILPRRPLAQGRVYFRAAVSHERARGCSFVAAINGRQQPRPRAGIACHMQLALGGGAWEILWTARETRDSWPEAGASL